LLDAKKRNPNCIVAWANKFFMDEIYHLAKLRTKLLGTSWVVDHIIPISNPLVSGLHNEFNLQVITRKANLEKSNSFEPVVS
jgi:5-methylcytosine-specific restriction endonuclease McrA